ncbi:MAG: NAD(P)H-binding protein, partial [Xanthomonadales bacterium]|nr:NAD(P)H-binding protein [Gammaproteobacteria bacterium]NNK38456.1 NAD(P)H-binding protein [Xanthomonadales bacterium]
MIYGANGYTGRLTAEEAVRRGLRPVLAGRNGPQVTELADRLGLESRVFGLDDTAEVIAGIEGQRLVLH